MGSTGRWHRSARIPAVGAGPNSALPATLVAPVVVALVAALVVPLLLTGLGPLGRQAAAQPKTRAAGLGASSAAVVWLTGLDRLQAVSTDGSLALGEPAGGSYAGPASQAVVALPNGTPTPSPYSWFVHDNPDLVLEKAPLPGETANSQAAYLVRRSTGTRVRIDTDSAGMPLAPAWQAPVCPDECGAFSDAPGVFLGEESISANGRKVAFCTNYADRFTPALFLKDTVTGVLTATGRSCGRYDPGDWFKPVFFPEISANGKVVHVRGDAAHDDDLGDEPFLSSTQSAWSAGWLYFTSSAKVRKLPGWGTMTRDGSMVFLRIGERQAGLTTPSDGRVGVYGITNRSLRVLPPSVGALGTPAVYGTDMLQFAGDDQVSLNGRRAIYATTGVIDRQTAAIADLVPILAANGYQPDTSDGGVSMLSGDGRVAFLRVAAAPDGTRPAQYVAVSGWSPTVRVTVSGVDAMSRLRVDVDPDLAKGSWTFQVQRKRPDGTWSKLGRRYRTSGTADTRVLDLAGGTYRVRVRPGHGYTGATSAEVSLAR